MVLSGENQSETEVCRTKALMGCFQGYHSKGGAQGVGAATTKAVVTASIMILTANYVVTELFFSR